MFVKVLCPDCQFCQVFEKPWFYSSDTIYIGTCRKKPPTGNTDMAGAWWAEMKADDWCGEGRPRAADEQSDTKALVTE